MVGGRHEKSSYQKNSERIKDRVAQISGDHHFHGAHDRSHLGYVRRAYPNFMEDAAQKMGGDFFVLPSSIHEVLLVRDNGQMTAKELENMVKEVNATQVEPADQLTDHVYHYDSQNHIFELADKYEERQREAEHEAVDKDSVLGDLKEKKQEIAKKDPAKDAATKAATKKHETSL